MDSTKVVGAQAVTRQRRRVTSAIVIPVAQEVQQAEVQQMGHPPISAAAQLREGSDRHLWRARTWRAIANAADDAWRAAALSARRSGATGKEIADALGISPQAVSKLLRD